jgi:hypothetical protein
MAGSRAGAACQSGQRQAVREEGRQISRGKSRGGRWQAASVAAGSQQSDRQQGGQAATTQKKEELGEQSRGRRAEEDVEREAAGRGRGRARSTSLGKEQRAPRAAGAGDRNETHGSTAAAPRARASQSMDPGTMAAVEAK